MSDPNWGTTKAEYWKHLPAPARPWLDEVAIFEEYALTKKEQGRTDVLILGSTVEFRSMLHKHGMNVHVVDFSRSYYDILSQQPMEHQGEETFYEQNWLTMDLGKQFDLIFGDWVPGVLHTIEYAEFFLNIGRHLKEDGLFITRMCLRPDRSAVDLEKVVERHNTQYADRYTFYETSMQYVYGYHPDPVTSMWNIQAAKEALRSVCDAGLLDQENCAFMEKALAIEKEGSASIMVQEDFDTVIADFFTIIEKRFGKEPSAAWYPIYVLQKREHPFATKLKKELNLHD